MVATTGEDAKPTMAEMDSSQTSKVVEETSNASHSKKPTLLEILQQRSEEMDERTESELSPRANTDNDDAMKYGFGAGMRMYAKSLAMAEKQEATSAPVVRKVVPKDPVVIKPPTPKAPTPMAAAAVSPKAPTPKASTPKAPTPKAPTPKAPTPKAPTPKEEPAIEEPVPEEAPEEPEEATIVAVDPPTAMEEPSTTEVQAKVATPEPTLVVTDEVAAVAAKSIACGSIFQQIQDAIGEFFRKTEDCVDDAHERVCTRETACASTAMKNVDDVAEEMVEPANEGVAEVEAEVVEAGKEKVVTPSA